MAYQKSGNTNRGDKRSSSNRSEKRPSKSESREGHAGGGNRRSFISRFSKKRTEPSGEASPEGKQKRGGERLSREGSTQRDKKRKDFPVRPNRAFSPEKRYFKRKEGEDSGEKKFPKKRLGADSKKPTFDRETRKKSFGGESGQKSFGPPRSSRPKKFTSYKKKNLAEKPKDGLIRLNKFISNSGVCSRREADELIKMGLISVNGQVITEMGYKVKPTDDVRHESKKLTAEKPVYILLNKPKGFITTTDDPQERKTVMHLIGSAVKERIYPVGRLDRNTTGLLLLTNDGELAERLTHPSYKAKKIYRVELDKNLSKADFDTIVEGIRFEEGKAMVDDLAYVDDLKNVVGIELHIGWNRIVRRIFEALGYEVLKLDRVVYAGLDKKNIGRGEWRFLRQDEVTKLKHLK